MKKEVKDHLEKNFNSPEQILEKIAKHIILQEKIGETLLIKADPFIKINKVNMEKRKINLQYQECIYQ